ncbi:hypothetical protein ATANTOWER_002922 [Ataeniobius toweri]|uniref:Uncharacterized protein n=1 Tax=Ataeniobius toweri TaxID=208326 RepID=A0ABU7B3T5_9TELE|nr:hypothetical protein [Ataeniobius toweri]
MTQAEAPLRWPWGILWKEARHISGRMPARFASLFMITNCFPAHPAFSQEDAFATDCNTSLGLKAVTHISV